MYSRTLVSMEESNDVLLPAAKRRIEEMDLVKHIQKRDVFVENLCNEIIKTICFSYPAEGGGAWTI